MPAVNLTCFNCNSELPYIDLENRNIGWMIHYNPSRTTKIYAFNAYSASHSASYSWVNYCEKCFDHLFGDLNFEINSTKNYGICCVCENLSPVTEDLIVIRRLMDGSIICCCLKCFLFSFGKNILENFYPRIVEIEKILNEK